METFSTSRTVKGDQLSLLDRISSTPKIPTVAQLWDAVAGRAYTVMTAIPQTTLQTTIKSRYGAINFHREASKIGEKDFVLKVSIGGRGYMLRAMCRHRTIPSHYNEDSIDITELASSIHVREFNNGDYIPKEQLNEKDRSMFTQIAKDILSNPFSSRSMMTH
ncbi:MAG: hypothetical protein ACD_78C00247G0002 [uncultured bacterium (gcode 4)]|uniref:Uncharacterized protein n=1 Tax=uncultured bacterium (gcode 4) TaxID=1234023 RepID=K1XHN3_9BACT|nr:MAG: hypothetical protein ACD_78C00247G0002 [uncultured bacterium (gcode 4)]